MTQDKMETSKKDVGAEAMEKVVDVSVLWCLGW